MSLAFCTDCEQHQLYACLKAAQTICHHAFYEHITLHAGLWWYTPQAPGPPNVHDLSVQLNIEHVYCLMPINVYGERIPGLSNVPPIPKEFSEPSTQ